MSRAPRDLADAPHGLPDAQAEQLPEPLRPRLTVLVTNYNGRALLEGFLRSLASQTYRDFKAVVVDDGSSDDSISYLHERWPSLDLIELAHGGVTVAMNAAITAAHSELVGLFNNDIELEADCLAGLVEALDRHPDAGSATPKMLDFSRRDVLDGAGDLLSWRGGGRRRGHGCPDTGQYDHAEEVFGPCGGAALFRRSTLDAVGGFDEDYFAYYEDLDWAFRAQLAGFRCRYAPDAVLYHRGSATLGRGLSDFNCYQLWRNPIWLIVKCYPAGALLRHSPDLLRGQIGNLYVAVRERKLGVWARALRDALRGLPASVRKRRHVQGTRVISLDQLEAIAGADRR